MFESLQNRFQAAFRRIRQKGRLTEDDLKSTLREIRMILLEADVNLQVTKDFVAAIRERAAGAEVAESLSPGQQIIKIVYEELTRLLGSEGAKLEWRNTPAVCMLLGLQGSGKTTTAAKLARLLASQNRKPALVAADPYRPAAAKQLEVLADQISAPFFDIVGFDSVPDIVVSARKWATEKGCDTAIVDTAGRLHIDEKMIEELVATKKKVETDQSILVLDSTTGQDAVKIADEFASKVGVDGFILTKLDSDTRGGAALAVRAVTGKPILYVGTGEKLDALEAFNPDRMARRILGLGDMLTLIEKAETAFDEAKAAELAQRLEDDTFGLDDFLEQFRNVRKMGPLEGLLDMIPGVRGQLRGQDLEIDERELVKTQAIIESMTKEERRNPKAIDGSRKKRIASGSGTTVQDVNSVLAQFKQMKQMMGQFGLGPKAKKKQKRPKGLRLRM
jgi:signal recognition particle subunit SRP54